MFCYKILSILVFVCLVIALVACLIGTLTKEWWNGKFEAIVPLNITLVPSDYKLHLLFNVQFGLTKVCWGVKQAKLANDSTFFPLVQPMKKCMTEVPETKMKDTIIKHMSHFKNILICMIVAIIFNGLALIFASVKLPCVKISRKPLILFLTTVLSAISAIACIIALVIADDQLHYDAPFMKLMLSQPPPAFASGTKSFALKVLQRVFNRVRTTDLSDNFGKGDSFALACVATAFLLIAVILSLFEHCCAKRSGDDEHKSELISDGYSFPPENRNEENIEL